MEIEQTHNKAYEVEIDAGSDGQRIDNFLLKTLKGVPKTRIYRILRKGEVRVNKGRIKPCYRLAIGDRVRIPPIRMSQPEEHEGPARSVLERLQQAIMFEDDEFLIINKYAGIAVHGGSGITYGVIEGLRALRPDAPFLELGHRLDRATSGCLVVAKKRSALRNFQKQLTEGGVAKHYLALVAGEWQGGQQTIRAPLMKNQLQSSERIVRVDRAGKDAISIFTPVEYYELATLMRITLITGRTHQVRVHAQHSRHPIAGDDKYGDTAFNQQMAQCGINRLFLHAVSLRFTIPELQTYQFEAPLDPVLQQALTRLTRRDNAPL